MRRGTPLAAFVLLVGFLGEALAQTPEGTTASVPTFYSESRQIIVEAEAWDKTHNTNKPERSSDEPLRPGQIDFLKHLPTPTRDLTSKDFHVFDNGVEQVLNYFREADFPAVDTTGQWRFVPTAQGTWGFLLTGTWALELPTATYLIGYVPPVARPGECRSIQVLLRGHEVQVNRDRYCATIGPDGMNTENATEPKLDLRMRRFAASTARASVKVSAHAFAFWSSGILSVTNQPPPTASASLTSSSDFTYRVEVHDAKAPATVQIAIGIGLPPRRWWDYPCEKDNPAVHVLGMIYKKNGEFAGQIGGSISCSTLTKPAWIKAVNPDGVVPPSRFDSQIELPPGDYDVLAVVSDGNNFGRARVPLRVEPFDGQRLMMSDVVIGGVLRNAAWIVREAASVSPSPVVPTPLVSKSVQFFPDTDTPATIRKHSPLFLYFEVYERLLETQKTAVYYRTKIIDLKSGVLVIDTEPTSAADWMVPGEAVIPIGLKLATDKLSKGAYRFEVQASDLAGRETEWRQVDFTIQ